MQKIKGICVQTQSRPGALERITKALIKAHVNILAVIAPESFDSGMVRIFPDRFDEAFQALGNLELPLSVEEAYSVELQDKPGALNEMLEHLSLGGINIHYLFCTTNGKGRLERVILSVSAPSRAEEIWTRMHA
jgi:hypothetical protein